MFEVLLIDGNYLNFLVFQRAAPGFQRGLRRSAILDETLHPLPECSSLRKSLIPPNISTHCHPVSVSLPLVNRYAFLFTLHCLIEDTCLLFSRTAFLLDAFYCTLDDHLKDQCVYYCTLDFD